MIQIWQIKYEMEEITATTKYVKKTLSINFSRSANHGLGVLRVSIVHFLSKPK